MTEDADRAGADVSSGVRKRLENAGPGAAIAAGVLWLLVWLHGTQTHGVSQTNEMRAWGGFTWMDSAKFLVLPFLFLIPPVLSVQRGRSLRGRVGGVGSRIVIGILALLVVAVAIEFWTFPWGSYDLTFAQSAVARFGGLLQAASSLALTGGFLLLAGDAARVRALPWWSVPVLMLGAFTTLFLTPAYWLPGAAWLLLGFALFRRRRLESGFSGL